MSHVPCPKTCVSSRAFTLIEMLVVSALFLVLGGGLLTAFLSGQTSYLSADAYVQVQQESRKAFDNMVRELRESATITCGTGATAGECPSAGAIARLNFQLVRRYDTSVTPPTVLGSDTTDGQFVHYAVIGTAPNLQLVRYRDGSAAGATIATCSPPDCRVLANNVDSVNLANTSFAWNAAAETVTLNLQIRYANTRLPGGSQTTGQLTSAVRLRN